MLKDEMRRELLIRQDKSWQDKVKARQNKTRQGRQEKTRQEKSWQSKFNARRGKT